CQSTWSHLVGEREQRCRHGETKCFGSLEIDHPSSPLTGLPQYGEQFEIPPYLAAGLARRRTSARAGGAAIRIKRMAASFRVAGASFCRISFAAPCRLHFSQRPIGGSMVS